MDYRDQHGRGSEVSARALCHCAALQERVRWSEMGSDAVLGSINVAALAHRSRVMKPLKLTGLVIFAVLIGVPAFAQFDLGGHWARRANQDDMESGPGPDPVDY